MEESWDNMAAECPHPTLGAENERLAEQLGKEPHFSCSTISSSERKIFHVRFWKMGPYSIMRQGPKWLLGCRDLSHLRVKELCAIKGSPCVLLRAVGTHAGDD